MPNSTLGGHQYLQGNQPDPQGWGFLLSGPFLVQPRTQLRQSQRRIGSVDLVFIDKGEKAIVRGAGLTLSKRAGR